LRTITAASARHSPSHCARTMEPSGRARARSEAESAVVRSHYCTVSFELRGPTAGHSALRIPHSQLTSCAPEASAFISDETEH